jgi:hypothetical protein
VNDKSRLQLLQANFEGFAKRPISGDGDDFDSPVVQVQSNYAALWVDCAELVEGRAKRGSKGEKGRDEGTCRTRLCRLADALTQVAVGTRLQLSCG